MNKSLRFFYSGIFVFLVVILGIWLVIADSGNLASSPMGNGTTVTMLWFNVSALNFTGGNILTSVTINQTVAASIGNVTNVTLSNGTVYYNDSFSAFPVVVNVGAITAEANFTLNFTINSSAADGATVQANVTSFTNESNVTFSALPYNSTIVTIDAAAPTTSYSSTGTLSANSKNTGNLTVNVTATDSGFGLANITISVNGTQVKQCSSSPCSYTNNSGDGSYAFSATANDTNGAISTLSSRTVTIDNTAPSVSASCPSSAVITGDVFPCSCSSSDVTSGVSSTSRSSNSPEGISTPSSPGTFTYTCSATDLAGNSASSAVSYTVEQSGGGGMASTPPKKTHSWTKITPGAATIIKDFDAEIGIKKIQIEVNNEAQNVKITVTKHDGKPAEVTKSKTGKIYKYLQIEATNLADKLRKATVTLQVEKSWLSSNGLAVGDIALFRFDESAEQWNELDTSYVGSEGDNELYEIELTSFSYFVISTTEAVEAEGATEGETQSGEQKTNLVWLWVVIAIIIIIIFWLKGKKFRKQ